MVHVLATMILKTGLQATVHDCQHVAKALVRNFPFLKEYVSACIVNSLICLIINFPWHNSLLVLHLQITHEMDMVCNMEKTFSLFEDKWKYVGIILKYNETIQSQDIQKALASIYDNDHDDEDACEDGNNLNSCST